MNVTTGNPQRERAAWTLAGWLGAALIAILTIMLGFFSATQQDLISSRIEDHQLLADLEKRLSDHLDESHE